MFYLEFAGDLQLVGASTEALVKVIDGVVETHPIAGTRRRGKNAEEDLALEKELLADEKERAEHIMLVDLGRNDVGRVAKAGSVKVEALMHVERYVLNCRGCCLLGGVWVCSLSHVRTSRVPRPPLYLPIYVSTTRYPHPHTTPPFLSLSRYSHVMHIVSRVTGQLRDDLTAFDAYRAIFPAGTVSGAPKVTLHFKYLTPSLVLFTAQEFLERACVVYNTLHTEICKKLS